MNRPLVQGMALIAAAVALPILVALGTLLWSFDTAFGHPVLVVLISVAIVAPAMAWFDHCDREALRRARRSR
jgi:hypothetical protein